MTEKIPIIRHGDITFIPIADLPSKLQKHSKVIKEGEQSGHYHQFVETAQVQCYVAEMDQKYVQVNHPAIIDHPEHRKIVIPQGIQKVQTSRELDLVGEVHQTQD